MSDPAVNHDPITRRPTLGQALVETALIFPIILILLLGAIDLGRLFFSYVTLHQAARVAANAASVDPATITADVPDLIADENAVMNCGTLDAPVLVYSRAGAPITNAEIGDYAQVEVSCSFELITPLATQLFGGPMEMRARASFPVRTGCLGCSAGTGGGVPPPPPPEPCRTVPNMVGMSFAGARHAWHAAGFIGAFNPSAGTDTRTIATVVITPDDLQCPLANGVAIFNASVTVVAAPADTEPAPCTVLPNLKGMTIAEARAAWDATDFTGATLPPPPDVNPNARVTAQQARAGGTPLSPQPAPGVACLDPDTDPPTDLMLTTGASWPAPPPPPCQVPHMIDKRRPVAQSDWTAAQFTGSFSPTNGNFVVKKQSIPGFSWVPCASTITVSNQP
jgi:TadE-like protein